MTKRVLQLCPHDVVPFAGLCAQYEAAANALGAEVTTAFLGQASNQPLSYADYLAVPDLSRTAEVRRALRPYAEQYWDLVICHRYRSYWSVVGTPLAKQRCVVVAHEYGFFDRFQRRLNRRLRSQHMHFAGVSEEVALEMAGKNQAPLVLPNVVDLDQAEAALASRAVARARFGINEEAFVIGMVGRIHYKKRPVLALQAFLQVAQAVPEALLVFVGEGDLSRVINDLGQQEADQVRALVASGRIVMTGFISDAPRWFEAFDVLLHPTQIEAFGMVVLEAMIAGVPVVTLPKGGPKFVLGDLGHYAQEDSPEGFAAQLTRLHADGFDAQAYRGQARARVAQHFSVPALSAQLSKLL